MYMIDCIFKNNGYKINNLNSNLATLRLDSSVTAIFYMVYSKNDLSYQVI